MLRSLLPAPVPPVAPASACADAQTRNRENKHRPYRRLSLGSVDRRHQAGQVARLDIGSWDRPEGRLYVDRRDSTKLIAGMTKPVAAVRRVVRGNPPDAQQPSPHRCIEGRRRIQGEGAVVAIDQNQPRREPDIRRRDSNHTSRVGRTGQHSRDVYADTPGRPGRSPASAAGRCYKVAFIARQRGRLSLTFVAFDVLVEGPVIDQPYSERRAVLDRLELDGPAWCAAPQLRGSVADVLGVCAEHDVEGIVAKRVDSPYRPGERSSDWLKLKTADWRSTHASQRHPR